MNILSRRITALRSNTSYQRYFMHMLFGGSNFQFYEPMSSKQGVVKHTNVRFFSSDSVNRHANYYWDDDKEESMDPQISKFSHKSNAQDLISQVPVIEVDNDIARCTGVSEFGFGHPVEYIALSTTNRSKPNVCKW